MQGPTLEIGPVTLRSLEPEDAWGLEPYFNDPPLVRLLGLPGPRDAGFLGNLVTSAAKDPGALYMAIELDEALVGYTFLDQIDWGHRHATETGVLVGPSELWDKGLGRAAFGRILMHAFDDLALHRASLGVLEENVRAIRSYEALGFKREGIRKESLLLNSGWVDTVMMGLLSPELNRIAIAEGVERTEGINRTRDG
jgi:RimJ/RimL family protein N-acetyltransferase